MHIMRSIIRNARPKNDKCVYSNELDHRGVICIDGSMIAGGVGFLLVALACLPGADIMPVIGREVLAFTSVMALMPKIFPGSTEIRSMTRSSFTATMALMPKIIRVAFMKSIPKTALTSEVQDKARSYMILSFLFMLAAFISYALLIVMVFTSPEFSCNFWAKLGVIGQALVVAYRMVGTVHIYAANKKNKMRIIGWE